MSGTAQEAKYFNTFKSIFWASGKTGTQWSIMTADSAVGSQSYLCDIAGGTAINNRIGNKVHVKKIVMKLSVKFEAVLASSGNSGDHQQQIKFALILDQQANGGVPTTYPWDTTAAGDPLDFMAFTKADNTRFRILKTKTIQRRSYPYVNFGGTGENYPCDIQQLTLKHKFAGDGLVMTYEGAAAGVPRDNAIYLVACSNINNVTTSDLTMSEISRLYFRG